MRTYHFFKQLFLSFIIRLKIVAKRYNLKLWFQNKIRIKIKKFKPPKLASARKKQIKRYYAERGYKNIKTYWHQYYGGFNQEFSVEYVPEDIFHSTIAMAVNRMQQWPALLDKNLLGILFKEINRPETILRNINGVFFKNDDMITFKEAIVCCQQHKDFVIKPSIDSGGGKNVLKVSVNDGKTDFNNLTIGELLNSYNRDYIIQKLVKQHSVLAQLNNSSLNTIRLLTYLRADGVHILSSHIRIGKKGNFTDNSSSGGISCGILDNGQLKPFGFNQPGETKYSTDSGVELKNVLIPSYFKVKELAKCMHLKVPYFRLIAWDIAISEMAEPVFIEYNTYRMGISSMQLTNGPLFNEFFDELLAIGKDYLDQTRLF